MTTAPDATLTLAKRFGLDRRPAYWVQLSGARPHRTPDNPMAQMPWWRDPVTARHGLRREYEIASDLGLGMVVLNRPAGTPGVGDVPGASSRHLLQHQSDAIAQCVEAFPGIRTVVFIGSSHTTDGSMRGMIGDRFDGFGLFWEFRHPAFNAGQATIAAWNDLGVRSFALDKSSAPGRAHHYAALAPALALQGVTIILEAVPHQPGRWGTPDRSLTRSVPCMATHWFFDGHGAQLVPNMPGATFDRADEHVYCWFDWSVDAYEPRLVDEYADRGLVPITRDQAALARLMTRFERGEL